MSLYEAMFLLDNRQANRDWDGSLESVKKIVAKHGGEIVRCEKWGERRLAYDMQGRRRGTYVLIYFNADGGTVNRVYRESELSELVIRVLMLKINAMPAEEKPAVTTPPVTAPAAKDVPVTTDAPEPAAATPAEPEPADVPAETTMEEVTPQDDPDADAEQEK